MSLFNHSVMPDQRFDVAQKELRDAEKAYGAAEDRLIRARRAYAAVQHEWKKFYYPGPQEMKESEDG